MKNQLYLTALSLSILAQPLVARTWTSDDGAKTFKGDYKSYDETSDQVTVLRGYKQLKFPLDKLSEADRTWVKEKAAEEAAKEAERSAPTLEDQLAEQTVGKNLNSRTLSRLEGKRFKKAELIKVPEYYILYFTASW